MKNASRGFIACFVLMAVLFSYNRAAAISLKTVTFTSRNSVWVKNLEILTDAIEKASGGSIRFQFVGGPEAIPPFEQIEAVKNGVVDVALIPGAYFVPQLPEADAMKLSPYSPWEERAKGVFQFYQGLISEKLGIYYLGKITGGTKYRFYLKKPVNKPDFKGLKIRVTPIYEPFVRAIGGVPVTLAPGEVYIALERGVVDGFGWPAIGITDLGWHEVIKYMVEPGFYQTDVCILINLKAWNKLGSDAKGLFLETIEKVEKQSYELSRQIEAEEKELLIKRGIKIIKFSGDEAEYYLDTANRAAWERIIAKNPSNAIKIKKLFNQ